MSMKFGRLLASGRSWVDGNVSGRYQMRQGLHLPQFISPKNPFRQEAMPRRVAPPPGGVAPAVSVPTPQAPQYAVPAAKRSLANRFKATAAVLKLSGFLNRVRWAGFGRLMLAAMKWVGGGIKRGTLFCLDHNPFSAIGRPKLLGIPRFGKSAQQGELSLDRVQVVRNELDHADLEVVRAGAGSK
jgi:hypothetical protein